MADTSPHVIKVGGSLLDLPDLPTRLDRWLAEHGGPKPMLVIGGGAVADLVRAWDRMHGLDEAKAHWICIDAMGLNTRLLTASLPHAIDVSKPEGARMAWTDGHRAMMQPKAWLAADHAAGLAIPHRWSFTSDSIAAHVAKRLRADRLTLLKSRTIGETGGAVSINDAAAAELVDRDFAEAARGIAAVRVVNLRDEAWAGCSLTW